MCQLVETLNAAVDTKKGDGKTFVIENGEDVSRRFLLFNNATVLCDAARDVLVAWVLLRNAQNRFSPHPACDRCVVSLSCKERAMGQKCKGGAK